jgi:outer membrane protein OmpA-like peptidoglycan-associated protein
MKKSMLLIMVMLPVCLMAQVFYENTTLQVEKISSNTAWSDFGPSFVGDELWYSGFTPEDINKLKQGRSKNVFYKLFSSPADGNGLLGGGKVLVPEQASSGYHAGPVSYCKKTGELFVTLSNFENAEVKNIVFQKKNIPLKIVILKKSGNVWGLAEELPFNSSSYSAGHPAISVTGDTLIFASNIPGKGYGGTDLYMAVRKNGKWGNMINLGNKINTSDDDMFPYLHKGNLLIYASNGRPDGMGGFDIYYASLAGTNFGEPVNFSAINTDADDFGLVVHPGEEVGYFVSNRSGGDGDDDIFQVTFNGEYELELLVKGRISGNPMPDIKVNFSDQGDLITDGNGKIRRKLAKATDYTAGTNLEGYMNESVAFSTKKHPYGLLIREIAIEKVEVGQKFVMENIYYLFDQWNLLPESETELEKLVAILKDNPSWTVELGSHTDSRGDFNYNDKLSMRRSVSAVDYIISKGISNERIKAKGYGENQLVNDCSDGISCTEEQHGMNRRTEFRILGMN